jgi:hypothetical protein
MEWRNVRAMHLPNAVGTAKEAHVDDVGLYLRARIVEPGAVHLVNEGVYQGFSIGGRKLAKTGDTVTALELVEISIVDRPANPDTRFAIAKGARETGIGVINPKRIDLVPAIGVPAALSDVITLDRGEVGFLGSIIAKLGLGKPNLDKTAETIRPTDTKNPFPSAAGQRGEGASGGRVSDTDAGRSATKREFSDKERSAAADAGHAMSDGSFPIESHEDLGNAVQAFGRAKNPAAAKRHIVRQAKRLGATHLLPEDWPGSTKGKSDKLAKSANFYTVSSMIGLLSQLEYLEECCEGGGSMCCGVPGGSDTSVECSKEFTDKFGSLLVEFADMTAELLDVIISKMRDEEAEEARAGVAGSAKAARKSVALDDDDAVSRLMKIAEAAGIEPRPAEGDADSFAALKNRFNLLSA